MISPPKPPTGLLKPSRDRWRQFWESPAAAAVHLESDLPRLVRWIHAADEYDRAAKVVKTSRLVRGSMGQPVLNPLVAYLMHLDGLISKAEAEFGMTPMARHRLKLDEPLPPEEDVVDQLRARRAARQSAG
jgi:P27 family predicted phage terminase small subunit